MPLALLLSLPLSPYRMPQDEPESQDEVLLQDDEYTLWNTAVNNNWLSLIIYFLLPTFPLRAASQSCP